MARRSRKQKEEVAIGYESVVTFDGQIVTDETNAKFRGPERHKVFKDYLVNNPMVGAGHLVFSVLVGRAKWRVQPANQSSKAEKRADFVREVIRDLPWSRVVRKLASYRYYGFALAEMIGKRRRDGLWGLGSIQSRPQHTIRRWQMTPDGHDFTHVWQVRPSHLGVDFKRPMVEQPTATNPLSHTEIPLPRRRLIHISDSDIEEGPEGLGLGRRVAKAAEFLEYYETLEKRGYQQDLRGTPVGYAPIAEATMKAKTKADKAQAAKDCTKKLQDWMTTYRGENDMSLVLDSSVQRAKDGNAQPIMSKKWGVELLKGSPSTLPELARTIDRKKWEIATLMSVEMLLMGQTSAGSMALAKEKTELMSILGDAVLEDIAESLTTDFLRYLWEINGWDDDLKPTLEYERYQFRSLQEITAMFKEMALAGAPLVPGDPAINEVRDRAGVSPVPPDLEDTMLDMRMTTLSEDRIQGPGDNASSSEQSGEDETSEDKD